MDTRSASDGQLDAMLAGQDSGRWDRFFADRARPVPFFNTKPDESLHRWIAEGCLPRGRAVDIGCGNGRNAIFLARHGFTVEGIEQSAVALAWAKEECERAQLEVNWRLESVFDADITPAGYDLVYDGGCFHHIAPHRREQYVRLVARALKPGGRFGLVTFRPEGGSGLTDEQVYERRTLGGGLGYDEAALRAFWSPHLRIESLDQMREQPADSPLFGKDFLWTLLASKP